MTGSTWGQGYQDGLYGYEVKRPPSWSWTMWDRYELGRAAGHAQRLRTLASVR